MERNCEPPSADANQIRVGRVTDGWTFSPFSEEEMINAWEKSRLARSEGGVRALVIGACEIVSIPSQMSIEVTTSRRLFSLRYVSHKSGAQNHRPSYSPPFTSCRRTTAQFRHAIFPRREPTRTQICRLTRTRDISACGGPSSVLPGSSKG